MGKYTYLFLDLMAIIIPLIASFDRRLNFYKKWKYALPALVIVAFLFLVWDAYFTSLGIWGFNEVYLTGIYVFNLPLEEILFFICIPYACLFTYDAFGIIIQPDKQKQWVNAFTWAMALTVLFLGMLNLSKAYTSTTFLSFGTLLIICGMSTFKKFLPRFLLTYGVILIPFFIINGILTGSFIDDQVVWYNDDENLGVRIFTIPVEDTFYGMLLILSNVVLFEKFKGKEKSISVGG